VAADAASAPARLGIIAGHGRFPVMVLDGAKRAGLDVTVIGLRGLTDARLFERADSFHWSGMLRLGSWIRILRRRDVRRVILAGSVRKQDMYARFRLLKFMPDWTSLRIWFFQLEDKRNDAVLSAVADEFEKHGIIMESCVRYSADDMAPHGVLTRKQPSADQLADARFGWKIAKEMGRLDIGQSIAVKEREVVAVEAIEGTDRMIERAGLLTNKSGWTLIKVAKPEQDMRFDVPTVGPDTIAKLKASGARMLVVEAEKTVVVEREAMLAAADEAGIVVLGHAESEPWT